MALEVSLPYEGTGQWTLKDMLLNCAPYSVITYDFESGGRHR
jgi:hypothetical protein